MRPKKVNILGVEYSITYVDKPSDVDIYKRSSLWGQIDCRTHTIRIYDNGRPAEDVFQSLIHEEILRGIYEAQKTVPRKDENLALALADVFFRNGCLSIELSDKDE